MELARMKLPRFLALKSKCNGKYLRCSTEEGPTYGLLRFSGDYVVSPYTKFEVEPAKIGKGLVHLRCCYNNKYWVRVSSLARGSDLTEFYIIAAAAKEPEENQSRELCTLFKPVYDNNNADGGIRFLHVQQGFYLSSLLETSTADGCASAMKDNDDFNDSGSIGWSFQSFSRTVFRCPNHLSYQPPDQSNLSTVEKKSTTRPDKAEMADQAGFTDCLYAGIRGGGSGGDDGAHNNSISNNVFEVVDWDSILILPRYVAFKDYNGKYLIPWMGHRKHKLLYFAGSDKGDALVGNEVIPTPDGNIRIRNIFLDRLWRHGCDGVMWICPDTGATDYDDPTSSVLFSPLKVENNVIAIRSLDNYKFCKSERGDWFTANGPTISKEAQIVMEEFVISRDIYDINYRLSDAKIHSQKPLTMTSGVALNETQEPNSVELTLRYVDSRSSTWNSTASSHFGVRTRIMTGVPFISDGDVQITVDTNVTKTWGETVTNTREVDTLCKVTVPPMSKVTVSLLVTVGSCDIPFSYTQRDVLYDGRAVTSYVDDGVYVGINHYNVRFETQQEKLIMSDDLKSNQRSWFK